MFCIKNLHASYVGEILCNINMLNDKVGKTLDNNVLDFCYWIPLYLRNTKVKSVMVAFLDPGVTELLVQTDFFTAQPFSSL